MMMMMLLYTTELGRLVWVVSDTIAGHQGDTGSQTRVLAAATARKAHLVSFGLHVSAHLAGFGLCVSTLTTALELPLKVDCSWSRDKGIVPFRMIIFFSYPLGIVWFYARC